MNKTYYICKYTPIELMQAFGGNCVNLNCMQSDFSAAEEVTHANICGFGKSIVESVLQGNVKELVLVNCCDTIRSVYDVLKATEKLDFLYCLDVMHCKNDCSRERLSIELQKFAKAYGKYKETSFDMEQFQQSFIQPKPVEEPYISVLGARMGNELFEVIQDAMPYQVQNDTCVNNRCVNGADMPKDCDWKTVMDWYAGELLGQLPCMRMQDDSKRRELYQNPNLKGIVYHTVKFCDFYGFEYANLRNQSTIPVLKIESDYTIQGSGQLQTRLDAFAESLSPKPSEKGKSSGKGYVAGIDSGSTSTDVVILNRNREIVAELILPTGAGAAIGAERALEKVLANAGLKRNDIDMLVTTGYGRNAISVGDKSITEISCHAKGAHFLEPSVRTVIDIGGQDSKVIRLDENGSVVSFVMNDKCAAGTGRFLEMMARTLEMSLEEMSERGVSYREDITISSMCTVFAESEVVSLIAENIAIDDIVHGINKSVATKTVSLVKRARGAETYMMTGGVSKNKGLVKTLEKQLGSSVIVHDKAQLCGALGAALFALEMQ